MREASRAAARLDCHIHSHYSQDGRGSLKELAAIARSQGLTGFFVTDHNTLRMAADIRTSSPPDLRVFPGAEVSTRHGHCLALGVRSEIPRGRSLQETLEAIVAAGGVGVPSHPYRRINGLGGHRVEEATSLITALEVYNARDGNKPSNGRAEALARRHRWGGTGGSDAHMVFEVGNAYTEFPDPVNTLDDALDQIRRGRTWGVGVPTPRSKLFFQNAKNLWLYARRGFRPM